MRRVDLHATAEGLGLVVTDRVEPDLRLEIASGGRILLRQSGRLVLLAKVDHWNYGVHVHRTGNYVSPLPPPRADQARRVTPAGNTDWFDRWAHQYASWLDATDAGPLHNGFWSLHQRDLPPYCLHSDLVEDYPAAYLDWFGDGWNGVLPLHQLPAADTARVNAYRRQVREHVLPPILLWWVSGFDGYLLVDGHHRLAAALAENVEPPVLVLAVAAPEADSQWLDLATAHAQLLDRVTQQALRSGADASRAVDALARRFVGSCAGPLLEAKTQAWPIRGGEHAWQQQAASAAPDWLASIWPRTYTIRP